MKMETKKLSSFAFKVIAVILGVSLFKQFDFKNFTFEKPALAIVYLIVFAFSIYSIVKNSRNR
jgi:predicted ferric reductase